MKWVVVIIFALFTLNVYSQAERKFIRRGNRQFEDKKYQEAEIQYRKALEKSPGSVAADYNLGNSLYKQKQFDAAAQRYKELSGKQKDGKALNSDYYNLGNALYKSGKYQECIDAYKNALRKTPGDMDAKHNLQLAMKKLEMQKQQKNKENQQNKQDKKQDNKKDDKQQQNQDNKNQSPDEKKDQQQDKQNMNGQISSQDAERILQALENEEKNVLRKVQEQQKQVKKVPVEKNW
jgi:Ca-activated chloride channel family protein